MEILEELCQRIYDIQQSVLFATRNPPDPEFIADMQNKITVMENEIGVLERNVNDQLAVIDEIPKLIDQLKSAHSICQDLPSPTPISIPQIKLVD